MGRGRESSRDESAVQADINRSLRESGGKWTSGLNDLVAERDRARSGSTTSARSGSTTSARSGSTTSGGLASLSAGLGRAVETVRSIPGNIARDVRMGTSAGLFANRDRQAQNLAERGFSQRDIGDFFARTDATRARSEAEMAARQNDGPSVEERAQAAAQQAQQAQQQAPTQQSPVYRNPFGQTPTAPGGKGGGAAAPQISPEMRQEALRIFESQRGAGQVPYQMMPFQQGLGSMRRQPFMPSMGGNMQNMQMAALRQQQMQMPSSPRQADPYDGMRGFGVMQPGTFTEGRIQPMPQPPMQQPRMPQQNLSPAFQRAAQNYNRLGGMQRTMDRPMEMMSVAERQRINQMAQGMAGMQRPTQSFGKGAGMQRPTIPSGKGGANPALLSAMFGSGIGSFRGSAR